MTKQHPIEIILLRQWASHMAMPVWIAGEKGEPNGRQPARAPSRSICHWRPRANSSLRHLDAVPPSAKQPSTTRRRPY